MPEGLSPKEEMAWRLGAAEGKETCSQRDRTVEPSFGQLKHNRRMPDFMRRGLPAVDSEWKLMNMTENIRKLYRRILSGKATAPGRPSARSCRCLTSPVRRRPARASRAGPVTRSACAGPVTRRPAR